MIADVNEKNLMEYKRSMMVEIANQFRDQEMILKTKFPGYGIHVSPGFSTDLNENCIWITPFVKQPGDVQDLRY